MHVVLVTFVLFSPYMAQDPASTEGMTPSEVQARIKAELRGSEEPFSIRRLPGDPPDPAPPWPDLTREPPKGGTVSVAALRHEVPAKALRAFEDATKKSAHGDYKGAARDLQKAIDLDSEFMEAHANLGAQYLRLGKYTEAVHELERAVALDPTLSAVHANLGVAQLRLGNFAAAEAHALKALEWSSVNDRARYVLGLAIGSMPGRREEAIEQLGLASRTIPAAKAVLKLLEAER